MGVAASTRMHIGNRPDGKRFEIMFAAYRRARPDGERGLRPRPVRPWPILPGAFLTTFLFRGPKFTVPKHLANSRNANAGGPL